jgi:hypothetical protein
VLIPKAPSSRPATCQRYVTPNSFSERLTHFGDEVVGDDDFARCYSERRGRPSIPPSVMVRALLCAAHDRLASDAECSRRTRVDADWKAAMGVDAWFEGIGATIFILFRARMVIHATGGVTRWGRSGSPPAATLRAPTQCRTGRSRPLTSIRISASTRGSRGPARRASAITGRGLQSSELVG